MKKSVEAIVKNEKVYCEEVREYVNIHSMTHPILKVRYSAVCDGWKPSCPKSCKYYEWSIK